MNNYTDSINQTQILKNRNTQNNNADAVINTVGEINKLTEIYNIYDNSGNIIDYTETDYEKNRNYKYIYIETINDIINEHGYMSNIKPISYDISSKYPILKMLPLSKNEWHKNTKELTKLQEPITKLFEKSLSYIYGNIKKPLTLKKVAAILLLPERKSVNALLALLTRYIEHRRNIYKKINIFRKRAYRAPRDYYIERRKTKRRYKEYFRFIRTLRQYVWQELSKSYKCYPVKSPHLRTINSNTFTQPFIPLRIISKLLQIKKKKPIIQTNINKKYQKNKKQHINKGYSTTKHKNTATNVIPKQIQ